MATKAAFDTEEDDTATKDPEAGSTSFDDPSLGSPSGFAPVAGPTSTAGSAQAYTPPANDPTGGSSTPYDPATGSTAPWDPKTNAPQSDYYPGWHWDPKMGRYMKDPAAATNPVTTPPPPAAPPAAPATTPAVPAASAAPAAPTAPAAPPPIPPTVSTPSPGQDAFGQSIRDALLKALGQGPVSANDEDIAPAIAANRVATERGLGSERDQIAERLNAQGLTGSGALDTQMQAARERATTGEAQFSGNAVLDQAKARRQQLTALLQSGAGIMNADETRQLQGKIADLDAFLRQQGITNQNTQFYDQLGMSAAEFQALMDRYGVGQLLGQ